jgi:hypothetical protein
MKRFNIGAAAAAVVMTLGVMAASPVSAGYFFELASDIDCDSASGEWVVTYTLRTSAIVPVEPDSASYILSGGPSGEAGDLDFTPRTVVEDQPSTATVRLPGSSTGLLVGSVAVPNFAEDDVEDQLDGSCQATPASTTPLTIAPEAPVAPLAARPTFTG